MYGAGANFFTRSQNRTKVVGAGAGVGSGTLDFRSRKCPKKWRLRNSALGTGTNIFYLISWFLSIEDYHI